MFCLDGAFGGWIVVCVGDGSVMGAPYQDGLLPCGPNQQAVSSVPAAIPNADWRELWAGYEKYLDEREQDETN